MTGTVAARLSAQPFFAALTDSQRGALAEDGTAVTFAAGERLFDEGGVADMFWLIEQGGIALDMRVPGRGDQIVETLGPGTVLGWSWLHRPYRWQFGGGRARRLEHTLRAVGAVTRALHAAPPGSLIGVRGPFGTSWDVASAAGRDVVI